MKCGESDKRNLDFAENFNIEDYFKSLINTSKPTVFDVGAHHGGIKHLATFWLVLGLQECQRLPGSL